MSAHVMHTDEREITLSQAKVMRRALLRLIETGEPLHIPNVEPAAALARIEAFIAKMEAAR